MQSQSKVLIGMTALAATLFGMAQAASAKTVQGVVTDQNSSVPTGTTYTGCNGASYWAQADGFRADGSLACLARSFANQTWQTGSCGADTVKYRGTVRSVGSTYCTGPTNTVPGVFSTCHVQLWAKTSQNPTCSVIDLGVWARVF